MGVEIQVWCCEWLELGGPKWARWVGKAYREGLIT